MSTLRSGIIFSILILLMLALLGRVAYLQTLPPPRVLAMTEQQQHQTDKLQARRGSIFDRNGMLLAGTVQSQTLFADPKMLLAHFTSDGRTAAQLDQTLERLAKRLSIDPLELVQKISDNPDARYVRLAERIDDAVADDVAELDIPGLGFEPTSTRVYPMGNLAAHVLGGMEGDQLRGIEGIEAKFNPLLSGRDGSKRSLKDSRRRSLAVSDGDFQPPEHGKHLVLTLDANLQTITQARLNEVCTRYRAQSAEAIVMDPRTGEVLALANWPTFSPQNREDSTPALWRDRAIVDPYEPGSTIKPFIVGPALMWKAVDATDVFPINGPKHFTSYGRQITDVAAYPKLAVWDVVVKSSNIGMTMIVGKLGNARLAEALKQWGFGEPTGIELPGENGGLIVPNKKWTRFSPDSMAQGYEMMVTPLQLARGMCAYANGGKLLKPTILRGTLDADGALVTSVPSREKPRQVVDSNTAAFMRRMLADVVVRGTGSKARSDRYVLFGKTGTAHRAVNGSYNQSAYTASFVGGAPYNDPRLVVAVIVHNPDRALAHFGGIIAAPVGKVILEDGLEYLGVPHDTTLAPPDASIAAVLHNFDPKLYVQRPETAEALHD